MNPRQQNLCGLNVQYIDNIKTCFISGFRRKVDEICALVGYYAAYGGNSLPTFRDNLSIPVRHLVVASHYRAV
jgi:hypothetical protein